MGKRYELGLAKGYVSDWSIQDALREFTQNGIDQENAVEGNTFSIEYNPESEELRMKNKKSILHRSTLLLGCTSKADDTESIGKFGEGYKLAVLVLLRSGLDVSIENYGAREVWKFRFSRLKKYDQVESLVVDIDTKHIWQKVPDNDLTVVIKGIGKDEYEKYVERKLSLDEDEYISTSYGRILLKENLKGKIYVNGLFVANKLEYAYGYDLKPEHIKIGRDRNLVDNWDLSAVTRDMWLEIEDMDDIILKMIADGSKDVEHLRYTWNTRRESGYTPNVHRDSQKRLADTLWQKIRSEYGDVILVPNESERKISEKRFGMTAMVLPTVEYDLIAENSDDYSGFQESLEEVHKEEDLDLTGKIWKWAYDNGIDAGPMEELFAILEDEGVVD